MSKKSTISILGTGWLGEPLGASLVRKGFKVKGATTSREKSGRLAKQGIAPYLIKVDQQLTGENIPDFFQTDVLLINIPPGRKYADVEQRFPRQVQQILAAGEKFSSPNYLFISSSSVYGNASGVVTETNEPQPTSASGKALLKAEQYLRTQLGNRLTILRPAGLVGGKRRPGRWFAGKKNLDGGDSPVNMIHQQDCITIITAIIQQQVWGEIFNLCADEHPVKRFFYPHQAIKDGLEPPTYQKEDNNTGKVVSNKKVKKILSYTFQFPDPMAF